jgi:hypothetical protein
MAGADRARPKTVAAAAATVEEYPDEVEADLHRYYGVDLVDVWKPAAGLTWRKVGVLIRHLPPESALMTAVREDNPTPVQDRPAPVGFGAWSSEGMLLAACVDALNLLVWQTATINRKEGSKPPPRPDPVRRPGVPETTGRTISRAGFAYLERLRAEHARLSADVVIERPILRRFERGNVRAPGFVG